MNNTKPLDKRRKYYLVLDCETATLPFASTFPTEKKKAIAISKPLIYDLGWKIIDSQGNVYRRKSYLISEIFSVPYVFNTAYYASKRPLYLEKIRNGEITVVSWAEASGEMVVDMAEVVAVGAYNAMFDFKKAVAFTEEYISHLYSEDFFQWEKHQNQICKFIANTSNRTNKTENVTNSSIFEFRGLNYPLFDIWGLACENLLDCDEFRNYCKDYNLITASGKYFPTNAEVAFRFLRQDCEFVEAHMAVEDVDIECEILAEVFRKVKPKDMTMGIIYFPFRVIGRADLFA